jgi:prepilin-type N-terminal cleavage/methylation domain-containing protein
MKNRQSPFSLIEMIVVITIIAILFSLLMPAFGRARDVAQQAVCCSNMKQLYTAHILFANTNKGNPVGIKTDNSAPYYVGDNFGRTGVSRNILNKPLNRYLESNLRSNSPLKIVDCPKLFGTAITKDDATSYVTNMGYGDGCFATGWTANGYWYANRRPCTSLSMVNHPSGMALLYEIPIYQRSHYLNPTNVPGHFTNSWNSRFNLVSVDGSLHQQKSVASGQVDFGSITLSNCATSSGVIDPNCPRCSH